MSIPEANNNIASSHYTVTDQCRCTHVSRHAPASGIRCHAPSLGHDYSLQCFEQQRQLAVLPAVPVRMNSVKLLTSCASASRRSTMQCRGSALSRS